MITATYPGTFDPLTNGHLDLIRRACWIFPKLIVAVAESKRKHTLFTLEERVQMAKESVKGFPNVEVMGFEAFWGSTAFWSILYVDTNRRVSFEAPAPSAILNMNFKWRE